MKKPNINEPAILRASLRFTKPGFTPAQRVKNTTLKIHQVVTYLHWLGFSTLIGSSHILAKHTEKGIKVYFSYQETEKGVYKTFVVTSAEGCRSNITLLRKMYPKK